MTHIARMVGLSTVLALTACSTSILDGDKIDYKSAGKAPSLEVPPDLTQLNQNAPYSTDINGVSASSFQKNQTASSTSATSPVNARVAPSVMGEVSLMRDGSARWLLVKQTPDKLWDEVKEFWIKNGFLIATDRPELGMMETDWAENRAKLPQDVIRDTLGKVFDSLYSTGERDRFRTRLDRTPEGYTEIYITHKGMEEVYASSNKDRTVWQPRPVDPSLEAEFLRRLMVRLGEASGAAQQTQANASSSSASQAAGTGSTATAARAVLLEQNNQLSVQVNEGFDRAWRRVGLTLDRTGFTVEDRDRSKGTYFVRYVTPEVKKEPGLWTKLFGSDPVVTPVQYQILLKAQEEQRTTLSILNAAGEPQTSENAKRIAQVLVDDLK